jgi:MORN repeat
MNRFGILFQLALLPVLLAGAPAAALASGWIADPNTGCKVWNPHPSPGETARWAGPCKDGFADGKGVLDWLRAGSQYERDEGEWRGGRQVGEGTQTWPRGQYKGQLSDSLPHGTGVLTFGGARYDGAFLNGRPNGSGALTNMAGTFEGTWTDGCFNDGRRRTAIGVSLESCP